MPMMFTPPGTRTTRKHLASSTHADDVHTTGYPNNTQTLGVIHTCDVHSSPSIVHISPSIVHISPSIVHISPSIVHISRSIVNAVHITGYPEVRACTFIPAPGVVSPLIWVVWPLIWVVWPLIWV
eukprot:545480-Prorocentrum_minimum.AAC.1